MRKGNDAEWYMPSCVNKHKIVEAATRDLEKGRTISMHQHAKGEPCHDKCVFDMKLESKS